jgi:hypothetical protein
MTNPMYLVSADGTHVVNIDHIKYLFMRENILADTDLDAMRWELVTDTGVVLASSDVKPPSAGDWLAAILDGAITTEDLL